MSRLLKRVKHAVSALTYRSMLIGLPAPSPVSTDVDVAVACLGALGDFIVFCSVARALRNQGKRLALVCRDGTGIEEFARLTGFFDVIVSLSNGYLARLANVRRLRRIKADKVIVAVAGRYALSDLYALGISAKQRILPDTLLDCTLPAFKRRVDRMVDALIPITAVNEMERYEQYLSGAGLYHGPVMPFILDGREGHSAPRKRRMVVFPGAGAGAAKRWPVERFAAVANRMRERRGFEIVVCGTADEHPLGESLRGQVPGAINMCGKLSLTELVDYLDREVSLVLCNDTGSAHLSIACGLPTVVVCGGWEYGRFYPNPRLPGSCRAVLPDRKRVTCIPCRTSFPDCEKDGPAKCVLAVGVEKVLKICNIVLSHGGNLHE